MPVSEFVFVRKLMINDMSYIILKVKDLSFSDLSVMLYEYGLIRLPVLWQLSICLSYYCKNLCLLYS